VKRREFAIKKSDSIAGVVSSTVHLVPIWKVLASPEFIDRIIGRWADVLTRETDEGAALQSVLAVLYGADDDFRIAWSRLSPLQEHSATTCIRNIISEYCRGILYYEDRRPVMPQIDDD
jgi:hypothetical protein